MADVVKTSTLRADIRALVNEAHGSRG